ncbi:MAG: pilus assembly protein TadG-related protein [Candidatus Dormiibacterota bacterium]
MGRRFVDTQSGQVAVLFAISLLVLVLAVGVAIDGGFGLLQYRQAQNAADFASEAVAQALYPQCTDIGVAETGPELVDIINDMISTNSPSTITTTSDNIPPYGWTGYYLGATGQPITVAGEPSPLPVYESVSPYTEYLPPTGTCGVHITVTPTWPPFVMQILGVTHLETAAAAAAVNPASDGGPATAIVALAENGPHIIGDFGDGEFQVQGTVFDNSDGCLNSSASETPPSCSTWGATSNVDVIDGKQDGSMYDWGDFYYPEKTISNENPLDSCFATGQKNTDSTGADPEDSGTPATFPVANPVPYVDQPIYDYTCADPNGIPAPVNIYTDNDIATTGGSATQPSQYTTAPISVPPPEPANAGCGGELVITGKTGSTGVISTTGGITTYEPGYYEYTPVITGNAVFDNCSQVDGVSGAATPAAGIYYFENGIAIEPVSGDTVSGTAVVLATQNPIGNGYIPSTGTPGKPASSDSCTDSYYKGGAQTTQSYTACPYDNGYYNVGDGEPAIGLGSEDCNQPGADETCSVGTGDLATSSYDCGNGLGSIPGIDCNPDATTSSNNNSGTFTLNPVGNGVAIPSSVTIGSQPDNYMGQGLNDSLYIGGDGTTDITGPLDGLWTGFVTWQESTVDGTSADGTDTCTPYADLATAQSGDTVCANDGFDNLLGDSDNITLEGVVYNNSFEEGQDPSNETIWGGNAALPYAQGGMIDAGFGFATDPTYTTDGLGYGTGGTGQTCGTGQPGAGGTGCDVFINGLAMVDIFQTQGVTQLAIGGSGLPIPGLQGSGAILTY